MSEERESVGRIEVAPEVLTTIARFASLDVEGVRGMAPVPTNVSRLFKRSVSQGGILLQHVDNSLKFDIYVLVDPHANIREASVGIQASVTEAMERMVGLPVAVVNVHVEDVVYANDEAA